MFSKQRSFLLGFDFSSSALIFLAARYSKCPWLNCNGRHIFKKWFLITINCIPWIDLVYKLIYIWKQISAFFLLQRLLVCPSVFSFLRWSFFSFQQIRFTRLQVFFDLDNLKWINLITGILYTCIQERKRIPNAALLLLRLRKRRRGELLFCFFFSKFKVFFYFIFFFYCQKSSNHFLRIPPLYG